MKTSEPGLSRGRLRSSYFTSIVSIMLLLFVLGLLGFIVLNTQRLADFIRENIGFTVMLADDAREGDILRLQKTLDAQPYTKSTKYISKEDAAKEMEQELGQDFISFLGYNPLQPLIEVKVKAAWANPDSLSSIDQLVGHFPGVSQVYYEKSLLEKINENVKKISIFLLTLFGLLFLIALALINNTIRLSIYSRRLVIRTMQLVGATNGFIRRPFILKGALHGIYAGIAASALLTLVIYYGTMGLHELYDMFNIQVIALLYPAILLAGVVMSSICTFFAVNKYLHMKRDQIYV